MTKMVENQRNWSTYKVTKKIGIISTYFTEQFLEETFQIVRLSPDNFEEEIGLYGIDTIYIDNDIYEIDHDWYKKDRSELFRYIRKQNKNHFSKNIIVVKNTSLPVSSIFKKSFVLEIDSNLSNYIYQDYQFKVPIQLNYKLYNPSKNANYKSIDLLNINFNGTIDITNTETKNNYSVKNVNFKKLTRKSIMDVIDLISKSKILNVAFFNLEHSESQVLKYFEVIASIYSTYTVINSNNSEKQLYSLINNYELLYEISFKNERESLLKHTSLVNDHFSEVFNNKKKDLNKPFISIITVTNKKYMLEQYIQQINNQKNVTLEINLILHGIVLDIDEKENLQKKSLHEINFLELESNTSLGECLNLGVKISKAKIIAKIDDDDFYGRNYIIDQWVALKYSSADLVGKAENLFYFEQDDTTYLKNKGDALLFTKSVNGASIITYKTVLENFPFAPLSKAVEVNFLRRINQENLLIYSTHSFGMCVNRRINKSEHILKIKDFDLQMASKKIGFGFPEYYINL